MQKIHINIKHSFKVFYTLLLLFCVSKVSAQTTMQFSKTFDSNGTIDIPQGATNVTVKAWGAGGGGARSTSNGGKAGAGGGAYAETSWSNLAAGIYTIVVGTGGSGSSGTNNGGDSRFYLNSNTNLLLAKGGSGVADNATSGGIGGQASACVGNHKVSGNDGTNSGAGGAGANSGGAGGAARTNNGNGNNGTAPGGGGGGGRGGNYNGGAGGAGRVIVTYTYVDIPTPALMGSGSRDLYPSGATGHRAGLMTDYNAPTSIPFTNNGVHYIYAKSGETITLASSALGIGQGRIRLYNPSGTEVVNTNSIANGGLIPNRSAELAGPVMIGQDANEGRYKPIYYTVPVNAEGIYRVEFISPVSSNSGHDHILANNEWKQGNTYAVLAWDVAVINAEKTAFVPGRTYVTNLNLANGVQTSSIPYAEVKFNGRVFVRTMDGYTYRVQHNGSSGLVFAFFVNNLGFKENGIPVYKSINSQASVSSSKIHNPNSPDNQGNITHKMFYTLPSNDLPAYANASIGVSGSSPVNNSSTWLKTAPVEPNVTNLKLLGVEGTLGFFGHKGGHINFDAPIAGQEYDIQVILSGYGNQIFRTLSGTAVNGANSIYWDGKGSATVNGQTITSLEGLGETDVDIKVQLRGAEVHFPFFDIEFNQGGIFVELLDYKNLNYENPDNTIVVNDIVYWNDNDITTGSNPSSGVEALRRRSDPKNNSHTLINGGVSSKINGHKFAVGASSNYDNNARFNTFGDEKSLDTWTFITGTSQTIHSIIDVKKADLYTNVSYNINGQPNIKSAKVGDLIEYTVKAGNIGPSDVIANQSLNRKGATFTFQVPGGVTINNAVIATVTCANGTASEAVPLTYDASTRMYHAELNLSDGCSITYKFTGTLTGAGGQVAEATIMRPADVTDPDATNPATIGGTPTNPHFECYNHDSTGTGSGNNQNITCNNITEALFMILEDCVDQVLYYEDFDRGYFAQNSGRTDWTNKKSISILNGAIATDASGNVLRNGPRGGATSTYLFAPGIDDNRYNSANAGHSSNASVARIKNGYYSVNPPGYVQMGIPSTDSWKVGIWNPNASTNDPTDPNSNYDWTKAWDLPDAIRDMSGAVNGSAFLVRGTAAANQSIRPFYEFELPGVIQQNEVYTLDLYSYVTYHDKDYMLMDVVDQETGQIYLSVPLVNTDVQNSGNIPEGFQLGWIPLTASFTFDSATCNLVSQRNVKIAIRGSQDRALETSKGFGHTLIDNILFTKRTQNSACQIDVKEVDCSTSDCFTEVSGQGFKWGGNPNQNGIGANLSKMEHTFEQPATTEGFVLDIYELNDSFNIEINGVQLYNKEFQFGNTGSAPYPNVRFKSDGKKWNDASANSLPISDINKDTFSETDLTDRHNNPAPVVRVEIDKIGNVSFYGKRNNNAALEALEIFTIDGNGNPTGQVDHILNAQWNTIGVGNNVNKVKVIQTINGRTVMSGFGYGRVGKDCETCTIEKEGIFDDNNADGRAHVGESITYTFDVKNLGDMEIKDVTIIDPLFGFNITLDENTKQPVQPEVSLSGDANNNGVLDRNETWRFTVKYIVKQTDIANKGVYNRAKVSGVGILPVSTLNIEKDSTDPTPYNSSSIGWDPTRPFHTFVPLKGKSILITNPMIHQRVQ